ncbi:MAG: hypothetical protein ACJ758_05610 [Actinomycetota bacterium]
MGGILAACVEPMHGVACNDTPGLGQPHEGTALAPFVIGLSLLAVVVLAVWLAPRIRSRELR